MFSLGPHAWRISIWIQMCNGLFWVYYEYIIYWALQRYWDSRFRWFSSVWMFNTLTIFYITEKYLQLCKIDFPPHLQLLSCRDCVRDNTECCESRFRQEMQQLNSNQLNQMVNHWFFLLIFLPTNLEVHICIQDNNGLIVITVLYCFPSLQERDCDLIFCCTQLEFEVVSYRRCAASLWLLLLVVGTLLNLKRIPCQKMTVVVLYCYRRIFDQCQWYVPRLITSFIIENQSLVKCFFTWSCSCRTYSAFFMGMYPQTPSL